MSHLTTDEIACEAAAASCAPLEEPVTIPEKSRRDLGIALLLFVSSCLYLLLFYRYTNLDPDEGLALLGAQRILNGQVLYRDFFSFFTPGSYYWVALVFKLFGNSILAARAPVLIYGGLFPAFVYLVARRVCARWSSLFAAYLTALTVMPWGIAVIHNWDSTLWACAAIYCAVRYVGARLVPAQTRAPVWRWAFATGSCAAFTCLFEQSKGGGLVLGLAVGLVLVAVGAGLVPAQARVNWMALAAGFAWPFVATFTYFGFEHALPQMLASWLWPLQHYGAANHMRYGYAPASWGNGALVLFIVSPAFLVAALPILAVGILAWRGVRVWKRRQASARDCYVLVASGAISGLLLSILISNPNMGHIFVTAPPCYLVLAWMLDGADIRSSLLKAAKPLVVLYLFVAFTAFGLSLLMAPLQARCTVETRRGTLKAAAPDPVLAYLLAHVHAGSKMFVYPYGELYYYLTDTWNPTRYEYLQPGELTPGQVQEAIRELDAHPPEVVLFQPNFASVIPSIWPNTPIEVLAAPDRGAEYILAHYRPCRTLISLQTYPFVFMVRKGIECPRG